MISWLTHDFTNISRPEAWSLGPVQGRGSMPWQLDGKVQTIVVTVSG